MHPSVAQADGLSARFQAASILLNAEILSAPEGGASQADKSPKLLIVLGNTFRLAAECEYFVSEVGSRPPKGGWIFHQPSAGVEFSPDAGESAERVAFIAG